MLYFYMVGLKCVLPFVAVSFMMEPGRLRFVMVWQSACENTMMHLRRKHSLFLISSHEDLQKKLLSRCKQPNLLTCLFPKIVQETDQGNLKLFSHILTCLLMSCYSSLANLFTIHTARRHFCLSVRCCLMFSIILVWVRFSTSSVQEPIEHVLGVKFKISITYPINWYEKLYSPMQKTRLPSLAFFKSSVIILNC